MVSTAEGIAIAELCVYVPVLILTVIIIFRQGFNRQLGWFYLVLFCIIRCVGAGFKIASEQDPTNITDITGAAILQSVGLSPLLLASLGLLKRVCDEVSNHIRSDKLDQHNGPFSRGLIGLGQRILTRKATANSRRSRIIQVTQIPALVALILCIVGGINQSNINNPSDVSQGRTLTKAGLIMFVVVYFILLALTIVTMKDIGNAPASEKRIYYAVLAALPLLAVRLVWSLLATFIHDSEFNPAGGNPLVQLGMAIIEEFIIVCLFTFAGLTAVRVSRQGETGL